LEPVTTATLTGHGQPPTHYVRTTRPNNATPELVRDWLLLRLHNAGHRLQPQGATGRDPVYDALLVISELVTNAVLHARAPLTVTAVIHAGRLHLTVEDRPALNPRPATAEVPGEEDWADLLDEETAALGENGRGKDIVRGLCAHYHETTNADPHTVTAVLDLGGAA
jgi:hypothetical protein